MAHTMAFLFPSAEIEGVAPGFSNLMLECVFSVSRPFSTA